jgi:integrase
MALRMARPTKIKGSANIYFRERIPSDVLARVRGTKLTVPVGDKLTNVSINEKAQAIKVSLRTPDARLAKHRHRQISDHLARFWEAVRNGPKPLTHRECVALSGRIYHAFTQALGDDPHGAKLWENVQHMNREAQEGRYGLGPLLIGKENQKKASMEARFGGFADAVLIRHGLTIDAESRSKLLTQVAQAADLAAARLAQNAKGDYSPDPNAQRFGTYRPEPPTAPTDAITFDDLLQGWSREANPKKATIDQWSGYLADLVKTTGVHSPAVLKRQDVIRWKEELLKRGDSPKTINDAKLAAVKAVLNWAMQNGRIEGNPAHGVSVRQKSKPGRGMTGFSDAQAQAILAASAVSSNPARRWVPLLCAGSGARVAEITQLRRQDIKTANGVPYMAIRAEAGSVKNAASERDVPLHPQVIEAGFLEFVKAAQDGPLFHSARRRKADASKPPAKIVAKNLADWVRKLEIGVGRANKVDPNHGWRHWFRTQARAANLPDSVIDHIQGHAAGSVGQSYGSSDLATKLDALSRIPLPGHTQAKAAASPLPGQPEMLLTQRFFAMDRGDRAKKESSPCQNSASSTSAKSTSAFGRR